MHIPSWLWYQPIKNWISDNSHMRLAPRLYVWQGTIRPKN